MPHSQFFLKPRMREDCPREIDMTATTPVPHWNPTGDRPQRVPTEAYRTFMECVQKYVDEQTSCGIREIEKEAKRARRKAEKAR